MMIAPQPRISRFWPFRRVYYGWAVMTASMLTAAASVPMQGPIMGVFLRPIQEELGWSAASLSIGFAIGSGVGGVCSVWVGRALDRRGASSARRREAVGRRALPLRRLAYPAGDSMGSPGVRSSACRPG